MAAAQHNGKKPIIPVPKMVSRSHVQTDQEADLAEKMKNLPPLAASNTTTENTISMIFGAVVVGIILLLAVSFWRDWQKSSADKASETTTTQESEKPLVEVQELPSPESVLTESNENGEMVPVNLPARYTVKSGDSTWKLAMAFYGTGFNYVDIEAANGLKPDSDLNVGQQLTIPRVAVRQAAGGRPAGEYEQSATATPAATPTAAKGDTSEEMKLE